jgi:hypothetical protein
MSALVASSVVLTGISNREVRGEFVSVKGWEFGDFV